MNSNEPRRPLAAIAKFAIACCSLATLAHAAPAEDLKGYAELDVKPSATDPSIRAYDLPSRVFYDPAKRDSKILLWLAGTKGTSEHFPKDLLELALAHSYRVIVLSYITDPAVSQECIGGALRADPDCAAKFREKRIYGNNSFSLISDQPQDAIVHRLGKLLAYLDRTDPNGHWATYLQAGEVNWKRFTLSGQSQGGGMAEFLGQRETVDRVLAFSGGWDFASRGHIAAWYSGKSRTPSERWYGTYHVKEKQAAALAASYKALGIPGNHVFALDGPLPDDRRVRSENPYHGQGASNPAYRAIWTTMLGDGKIEESP